MTNDPATKQDHEATNPGEFTITPAMSKRSREKAEKDAMENAQAVIADINAETEKAGDAQPGDPVGEKATG